MSTTLRENLNNKEGGSTLDLVAEILVLNDDASVARIRGAAATMDEESGSSAHAVVGSRVEVIAVVHALEDAHVTQSVFSLWQWTNGDTALALWVVAARTRVARASRSGVDVTAVKASSKKSVTSLRIGIRTSSSNF